MMHESIEENKYYSYIIILDQPKESHAIIKHVEEGKIFTCILSISDLPAEKFALCLISTNGETIRFASLLRKMKGGGVSTGYKFEFFYFVQIRELPLKEVTTIKFTPYLSLLSSNVNNRVPFKIWREFFETIKWMRPEVAQSLEQLENRCLTVKDISHEQGFEIMMMERDAVGLALEIAGYDRPKILAEHLPSKKSPTPILEYFKNVRIIEDDLIERDTKVFGDWLKIDRFDTKKRLVQFQKEDSTLTVLNTNRSNIEDTLGVDLLYFHDTYKSFVMIQYKKLERNHKNKLLYRPIDKSYEKEIQRMLILENHDLLNLQCSKMHEYRLHKSAFYFKLCDPTDEKMSPQNLVPGLYFPLDYWKFLMNSKEIYGERGGKRFVKGEVRYINNTLFVMLVQDGWIGSISEDMTTLESLVNYSVESNNSLMVVKKESKKRRNKRGILKKEYQQILF